MKQSNNETMGKNNKLLFASVLVILGILSRTAWHLGDNVEFVTGSSLLAGAYLGFGWSLAVPVIIMFVTDLILGNTNIFLFTWSAYLLIGGAGYILQQFQISNFKFQILRGTLLGISASVWFYLWTNFGVWLLDSWGMYPKTVSGLMGALIMGLPFLKSNLTGNLLFIPASFVLVELIPSFIKRSGILYKIKIINRL